MPRIGTTAAASFRFKVEGFFEVDATRPDLLKQFVEDVEKMRTDLADKYEAEVSFSLSNGRKRPQKIED
jgi:hypothetical protein